LSRREINDESAARRASTATMARSFAGTMPDGLIWRNVLRALDTFRGQPKAQARINATVPRTRSSMTTRTVS
jgi:hypothetical protein